MEAVRTIIGCIGIFLFMGNICQIKATRNKKLIILSAGVMFLSASIFCIFGSANISAIIMPGLELIAALLLFQTDFRHCCAGFLFSLSYYTVIYYPIKLVLFAVGKANKGIQQISAEVITIFLILLFGKLIRKNENLVYNIRKARSRFLFTAGLCGFLDNGIIYFVDYFTQGMEGRGITAVKILNAIVNVFVYFLGLLIIYIDIIRQGIQEENAIKDKYLQMSKDHFQEISDHMQEVRRIKHDMKSHISSLEHYLKNQKYADARNYLNRMKDAGIYEVQVMNLVGNEMADAVISHAMGGHNGVRIQCEGVLPANPGISDYDLCTIFSNVVSNAAEACERLEKSEKLIKMKLGCYQRNIVIAVRNPIEWEIDVDRLGRITSKEEKQGHGYGIYNIKNTVEKLGGKYFFDVTERVFEIKIILNMQGEILC